MTEVCRENSDTSVSRSQPNPDEPSPPLYIRHYAVQLDDARKEIASLVKALEKMLVDPPATLDEPDTDADVIVKMREIARDALCNRNAKP